MKVFLVSYDTISYGYAMNIVVANSIEDVRKIINTENNYYRWYVGEATIKEINPAEYSDTTIVETDGYIE